jgi:pyrimidine operon attenuation protein/uracil phosphoribosyltransferase
MKPRSTIPKARHAGDAELPEKRQLLDAGGIARVLRRIASEIVERHHGAADLALVGVRTGGLVLAERLVGLVKEAGGPAPALGAVDITLYRDDAFRGAPRPEVGPTELPFPLPGRTIILVDDILYTGRTVRAALDALNDYGRPRAVELAVLCDRGHRELPIQADYVGMRVVTNKAETVRVALTELGDPVDKLIVRGQS